MYYNIFNFLALPRSVWTNRISLRAVNESKWNKICVSTKNLSWPCLSAVWVRAFCSHQKTVDGITRQSLPITQVLSTLQETREGQPHQTPHLFSKSLINLPASIHFKNKSSRDSHSLVQAVVMWNFASLSGLHLDFPTSLDHAYSGTVARVAYLLNMRTNNFTLSCILSVHNSLFLCFLHYYLLFLLVYFHVAIVFAQFRSRSYWTTELAVVTCPR